MPPAQRGSAGTAVASAGNVANPTTLNPPLPTHVAGDLLLCYTVSQRGPASAVSTPSGWTQLHNSLNPGGTNTRMALFGKIAASSSESTPSLTWSGLLTGSSGTPCQAQCAVFTGMPASIVGIVDVSGTQEEDAGGGTNTVCASGNAITTLTANDLVLALASRGDDAGTWTPPSGFTLIATTPTTSGIDNAFSWARLVQTTPGSVSPADWAVTGSALGIIGHGVLVALKPLVVAATLERSAALSADAAITAVGRETLARAGALTAAGAIAAAGEAAAGAEEVERSVALTVTATITTTGYKVVARAAATSATAAIVSIGQEGLARAAALTSTGAVNTVGVKAAQRQATLSGAAAISSSGEVTGAPETITGQADLTAAATLAAAGTVTAPQTVTAAAHLEATATIEVTIAGGSPPPAFVTAGRIPQQQRRIVEAAAHLRAVGRIDATNQWISRPLGPATFARIATLTGTGNVGVSGMVTRTATATLAATATTTAGGELTRCLTAAASLRLTPSIYATGTITRPGLVDLSRFPLTARQRDEELLLLIGDDL